MEAPLTNAQYSDTPLKDVVDLAIAIGRARVSMRHMRMWQVASVWAFSLPRRLANRTRAIPARIPTKEVFKPGVPEDKNGQKKWAAIKKSIATLDPALNARDDREEARVGNLDQRFNHWTAVRNGLINAHADLLPQIPAIVKTLPNPIDQMKLFELIQIIPSPTKSALRSNPLLNMRFLNRGSSDICETTVSSPLDRPTGPRHQRTFARFSMRCGCSTSSSTKR